MNPIFGRKAKNAENIRVLSEKKGLILCKIQSIIQIHLG